MKIIWKLCEFKWLGFRIWIWKNHWYYQIKFSISIHKSIRGYPEHKLPKIVNIDEL